MTAISMNKPKSPLARLSAGSIVLGVVSVVIAVALIGPIIDGGLKLFLQRIFDSLSGGAVYAVTAIALVLIFKATTLINFAGANIAMFGAYICWWFFTDFGIPIWIAIFLSMVIMAAFGAVTERVLIRPFDITDHLPVVLITFGLAAILEAFAGGFWGLEFHKFPSPFPADPQDRFTIGGAFLRYETIGTLIAMVLMLVGLYAMLNKTKIGLSFRAVSSNVESARLVGVRTGRTLQFGWALASALGVLGATLVAKQTNLEPAFMAKLTIFAFAAATLGGLDSIGGSVIGAFIVAVVQSLLTGYGQAVPGFGWLKSNFALVLAFVLILVVLLFKPAGLYGTRRIERV
ncbi:MAG: branched-chain amino acid ABC transporter permease [Acidimicrobiales bacterium]